jgi:hypothetical protein
MAETIQIRVPQKRRGHAVLAGAARYIAHGGFCMRNAPNNRFVESLGKLNGDIMKYRNPVPEKAPDLRISDKQNSK